MSMRPARVLAAATLLCTYGMVGCAVYSFVARESLDLVFYGTLPLTVLCGLLCVVHIVLASRLAGREEAMPLCRLALGWKLLEAPYFLTNFVLWLLVSGAFLVVPGLQLGLVAVLLTGKDTLQRIICVVAAFVISLVVWLYVFWKGPKHKGAEHAGHASAGAPETPQAAQDGKAADKT